MDPDPNEGFESRGTTSASICGSKGMGNSFRDAIPRSSGSPAARIQSPTPRGTHHPTAIQLSCCFGSPLLLGDVVGFSRGMGGAHACKSDSGRDASRGEAWLAGEAKDNFVEPASLPHLCSSVIARLCRSNLWCLLARRESRFNRAGGTPHAPD